jgi:hypothetical protein
METLGGFSRITFYVLVTLIALLTLAILWAQITVLRGRTFKNPDGTVDDWHEQKIFYGISFADVFLACPISALAIVLALTGSRWGLYLLALVSFWLLWANTMTTATSLRFEKPWITPAWVIVFPLGAVTGLAYIVWTLVHFDAIYGL